MLDTNPRAAETKQKLWRQAFLLPFRKTCFLLCSYISDGSTLVAFLVLTCLLLGFFWFFFGGGGYLDGKFSCFVGCMIWKDFSVYRLDTVEWRLDDCRMAIAHGCYEVCTLECVVIFNLFQRVTAYQNNVSTFTYQITIE